MNERHDDLDRVLEVLDQHQRSAVATFLCTPAGRALALATTPMDRVHAVHHWLNRYGLPPVTSAPPSLDPVSGVQVLPEPGVLPATALQQVLESRRSHYHYSAEPLRLARLGDLLHHALRISSRPKPGAGSGAVSATVPLSSAPSAGACNPVRVHIAVRAVDGLDPGVYSYDRVAHTLTQVRAGDPTSALRTIYGQPEFAERAPVTVLLTVALGAAVRRYGSRHYRTLHLDAGIVIQNLYLVATALGLGGCAVAGYRDTLVSRLLGCSGDDLPIAVFPVGHPADTPATAAWMWCLVRRGRSVSLSPTVTHRSGLRHWVRSHGTVLAVIALGGGLGSVGRYGLEVLLPAPGGQFPWGTFVANVSGCLLVGVLMVLVTEVWSAHRLVRPFLGIGLLGGFTTFSTYALEVRGLLQPGTGALAIAYLMATVLAALLAVLVGVWLTRALTGVARNPGRMR